MSSIMKSIEIEAPREKVFGIVTSPENWTRYVTSLLDVRDLPEDAPRKDATFTWDYKMMGIKISGKGTITEYDPHSRFALHMESKFPITETYDFEELDGGKTKLSAKIDFEMPSEMMEMMSKLMPIERMNVIEAESVLQKIKTMCEG